ncbi:dihydrolipoamide dehydrogenase [Bacillaceae bacterium JMAK1]|nr:dihydrolipoamide dehydrogenase [Bacillaceae bacterium JMAK1]
MSLNYDLVIIGAGTGGYVAAIKAAQLGKKVAIVEARELGGTCLHRGCIPSKSLLKSAEIYRTVKHAETFGVMSENTTVDFAKVQSRKEAVVHQLHKGIQSLLNKHKISIYAGHGRMLGPSIFSPSAGTVSVEMNDGSDNIILIPKQVLLATGSKPRMLDGLPKNDENVLTSDDALQLEELPASVVIIGGGVIGVEWASMLVDFGVEVTIVENAKQILINEDEDISKEMTKQLQKKGIVIHTSAALDVDSFKSDSSDVHIDVTKDGETFTLQANKLFVSVGRTANINDIGLQNTDIEVDKGKIVVNEYLQTKEEHIYAIGDVIKGPELAHAASHEGITAVRHMDEQKNVQPISENHIPRCIYSAPEVASIGMSEHEAKANGYTVAVGKVPFQAIGKALINGNHEGFCKVIVDRTSRDVLGVHIIGSQATELISEAALAMVVQAADIEIGETIHPHPTSSEVLKEAALQAIDGAIHV